MVRCFWLEPTNRIRLSLRRFRMTTDEGPTCDGPMSYCDAKTPIGGEDALWQGEGRERTWVNQHNAARYKDDPRWPQACAGCGKPFVDTDHRQVFPELIYRRTDTHEFLVLRDAPAGAMWDATWMDRKGPDGRSLMVRCPNGPVDTKGQGPTRDWFVDGFASNCTKPDDPEHHCWCRHGAVPDVTVDKQGLTCSAGAGSIKMPHWHGFLRGGRLVPS